MRYPSRLTCAAVLGAALLGQGALGQVAPEAAPDLAGSPQAVPGPSPAAPDQAAPVEERPDPPALVGRVARLDGSGQYRLPGQEGWQPAELNFPVTSGHAIWTGPGARAALQLGGLRLALESETRLEFAQADDTALHLVLAQGSLFLAVPAGGPALPIRITTPRGDAVLPGPGQMLVQAGAEDRPTRVALLAGQGRLEAEGLKPLPIAAGQALALSGTSPPMVEREAAGPPTALVAWAQGQEPRGPLPAAVAGMTGADDLSHQGEWRHSPEHGDLWVPPVAPGWAPYRQGRWAHVEPWGWSWVDDAPWGFAPFHYGRWVEWDNGWAWAPGQGNPGYWPVYAPALVTFFPGVRPGWLGWAPLRPWQAYQPPYWVSLPWFRRLNHGHVRDWQGTEAWWRGHRFAPPPGSFHAAATTLVPAGHFTGGRPVAPFAQPHAGVVAGPVVSRPGLAPALAVGLGVAALAARGVGVPRPPLPPALGPRPGMPMASLGGAPQHLAPTLRAPPSAGKPPPLGGAPAPRFGGGGGGGGPPSGHAMGKPGGWGGPVPGGPGGGHVPGKPGSPGGGPGVGPRGGPGGGGYAAGKPGGWGGPPSGGHFSAPPPSHFSSPPARPYSPPAPRYNPPAQAYNAPNYRAPPAPSYHAPPTQSFRAPPAPSYHAPPAPSFHAPPAQSYRAPSAPSHHTPSSPSRGHHR